jgi:very-short-patch-repair endonuclease
VRAKGAWPPDNLRRVPAEECIDRAIDDECTPRSEEAAVDWTLSKIAERQHGVVARCQLGSLGVRRGEVEARLRRGSLHQLHRGVYAVGHRVLTQEARWVAAVFAFGAGAVLSHRSAGQLWRIVPMRAIEPEVIRAGFVRGRPGLVVHRVSLPADEVTMVDGIPVTTAARAVFDLASMSTPREVERAFHELEVRRLWGSVSVAGLVERYPGHRGVATLRTVLGSKLPVAITRNDFEERFVAVLDAHGLPRPRFNATLHVRGRFFEPEALWDDQRLIAELDGGGAHQTDRAFHSDRKRDRALLAEGYRTTRVTWHQLRDEPDEVAADLRQMLFPD